MLHEKHARQVRQPAAPREMGTVHFPGMCAGENAAGDIPSEGKEKKRLSSTFPQFNFPPAYNKNEQECPRGKCKQQLHHPEAVSAPTATEMKLQKEQGKKREKFKWFSAENAWMTITPIPHQA